MKKIRIIKLSIIFCVSLGYLHADQGAAAIFEQANKLYKQGFYQEALYAYNRIQQKNAVINYNIGNCEFKLQNYGKALLYWRRAEREWGFGAGIELLNNICYLKDQLNGLHGKPESAEKSDPFFKKIKSLKTVFDFYIRSIPLLFFQLVFLILWILIFIFIPNWIRKKRKMLVAGLFTLIAIFGLILVMKYAFEIKQHGVVVSKQAKLLSGPGQNYQVLTVIPEATELNIEKESDGYYKIKLNGQIGWVERASVDRF